MGKYKYFSDEEVKGLEDGLCLMLDKAREIAGFPFRITSGYRPPETNAAIGGVQDSAHLTGKGVDLAAPVGANERERMCWALGLAGFKRIGSYNRHYHVDVEELKPQFVMWYGESK